MLKALDLNTTNTLRGPLKTGDRGLCSLCRTTVIAHCGQVTTWHWQHERDNACDSWAEPAGMTAWHLAWQNEVPFEQREVIIGSHRADIVTLDGRVCEIQHSPLNYEAIEAREACYGPNMLWIFDVRPRHEDRTWAPKFTSRPSSNGVHQWHGLPPKWHLDACRGTVLLDRGADLLQVIKLDNSSLSGTAIPITREQVVAVLNTAGAELPSPPPPTPQPPKPQPATQPTSTRLAMHWKERAARGIPNDPPVWTPEQWTQAVQEIHARRAPKGAPSDHSDH